MAWGGKRKASTKYVGSVGIYVVGGRGGARHLLVHRRGRQVSEPNTICAPGGIVERRLCGVDEFDFEAGARLTALKELREEAGVVLHEAVVDDLRQLPVDAARAYWGPRMHRNYCAVLDFVPIVRGPEKGSMHELILGGMQGIGTPAGDGYHAWVDARLLLELWDLMPGCRVPLQRLTDVDLPGRDSPNELALGDALKLGYADKDTEGQAVNKAASAAKFDEAQLSGKSRPDDGNWCDDGNWWDPASNDEQDDLLDSRRARARHRPPLDDRPLKRARGSVAVLLAGGVN